MDGGDLRCDLAHCFYPAGAAVTAKVFIGGQWLAIEGFATGYFAISGVGAFCELWEGFHAIFLSWFVD